jgi:pimeloyl-ACP methyl ester carboxylesterase
MVQFCAIAPSMSTKKSILHLPSGRVSYEEAGPADGTVVLLVHGLAGHKGIWDKNFHALADAGHRTVRIDLYGRGQSERVRQPHDSNLYIRQVAEVLGHLQVHGPVHLVGLSMGGAVVTCFAATYPQKVASICLVCSYGPVKHDDVLISLARPPVLGEVVMGTLGPAVLRLAPHKAFHDPRPHKGFSKWFTAPLAVPRSKRSLLSSMRHFLREDHSQAFATVDTLNIPKLGVWGRHDRILPLGYGHQVREWLPSARWEVLEQAGHLPQYEQPDAFNSLLMAHLPG